MGTTQTGISEGFMSAIVLFVGGLVGYGKLRGDVVGLRRDVDAKASRETVDAKFEAIMHQLEDIKSALSEMRA